MTTSNHWYSTDLIRRSPEFGDMNLRSACASLAALSAMGMTGLNFVTEGMTLAEGVRVRSPLRAKAVVKMVEESGGRFVSVDEAYILSGRDALARLGFYVEPISALVWRALEETLQELSDPVVAILTGSGYKVHVWKR